MHFKHRGEKVKTIESVAEYLEYISSIKRIHSKTYTVSCETFFRGQANVNWDLSPSLYRQGLFKAENLILTELTHICPNEILDNRFDTLVKMQHYGMPTRLLDTTTNPLVALFFACESQNEKNEDGAVYIFPNLPVSWSTDPLVEFIMDFVYDYYPEKVWLDHMLDLTAVKYANVIHRLMPEDINSMLHYLTIPAFAVMPAKTNERIEAQDGAFFIFGMTLRDREVSTNPGTLGRVYYNFDPIKSVSPDKIWPKAETIVIPATAKEKIVEQLDVMGINERKMFPDLSHQIAYTVNDIKKDIMKE